jgi:hypothetical protein
MFGGPKNLTIGRWGPRLLLAIVVILIGQVSVGLYVSAVLVQMYGRIIAAPLPLGADIFKWGRWLAWGHEAMRPSVGSGWHAIGIVVLLAVLVGASYGFRYFLVE